MNLPSGAHCRLFSALRICLREFHRRRVVPHDGASADTHEIRRQCGAGKRSHVVLDKNRPDAGTRADGAVRAYFHKSIAEFSASFVRVDSDVRIRAKQRVVANEYKFRTVMVQPDKLHNLYVLPDMHSHQAVELVLK